MCRQLFRVTVICILFSMSLLCGCTGEKGQPSAGNTQIISAPPLPPVTQPHHSPPITLSSALEQLDRVLRQTPNATAQEYTITYISTGDIDFSGNATRWLIGVRTSGAGQATMMATYSTDGWDLEEWAGRLPQQPIAVGGILQPELVISRNRAALYPNSSLPPPHLECEIAGGRYTITASSDGFQQVMYLDAATGAGVT